MADLGVVKVVQLITSVVNDSTSSPYPMARGPASVQATVIAQGTGTSIFSSIATLFGSNDGVAYPPFGTVTALGTLAAAGTSGGTASAILSLGTNYPVRASKAVCVTTATGAGLTFQSQVTLGM
jgi:hypothetical protein